eukprot:gene10577-12353_t
MNFEGLHQRGTAWSFKEGGEVLWRIFLKGYLIRAAGQAVALAPQATTAQTLTPTHTAMTITTPLSLTGANLAAATTLPQTGQRLKVDEAI